MITQKEIQLYIGLGAYKIGRENDAFAGDGKTEWLDVFQSTNDMLKRQVECTRNSEKANGFCFYSYQSLFRADGGLNESVQKELEQLKTVLQ